ncbi:MAG TPA: ABC transporter permease [Candidatus Saccharimonadales bacterium]|nr:ABC transporter permease [Candidatus Saccharimonadales bacterium]
MSAAAQARAPQGAPVASRLRHWAERNSWTLALLGLFAGILLLTYLIQPTYGAPQLQGLAVGAMPLAMAAVAQAIVVISGGIDLSIGSMMALSSVTAAVLMKDQPEAFAIPVVLGVLLLGVILGIINGALIVITRVPDIVVTLAMSFVWAGVALVVLASPGGGSAEWLTGMVKGPLGPDFLPRALVVLLIIVGVIWIPLRRSTAGLSLYAIGSNRLAAFRSGVSVGRTKVFAYMLGGLFSAFGGLALTATTGIGTPVPGAYTLLGVAAVVLGGVSLAGGRGGVAGPIVAVFVLALVRTDLTLLGVNSNISTVIQGAILIGVVMFGSFLTMRQART